MSDADKKISKFLSYVLRHRPEEIGLTLDPNGWAAVAELIEKSKSASIVLTEAKLDEIVASSDKQRFVLSSDGTRIRANQGHSIAVDLALDARQPPEFLFHGTATRFLEAIRGDGLRSMSRQHVHLSADEATARKVGERHGKVIVLKVKARDMWRANFAFFCSANGVWLTEHIAPEYLDLLPYSAETVTEDRTS